MSKKTQTYEVRIDDHRFPFNENDFLPTEISDWMKKHFIIDEGCLVEAEPFSDDNGNQKPIIIENPRGFVYTNWVHSLDDGDFASMHFFFRDPVITIAFQNEFGQ
jgi:hypothetical protein